MSNDIEFWEWVSEEMERRDLSWARLEQKGGVSNALVYKRARDQSTPTLLVCKAIADAFEMPDVEVLRRAGLLDDPGPPVQEEEEVIRILRTLSPHTRSALILQLRGLAEGERALAERFTCGPTAGPPPQPTPKPTTFEEQRDLLNRLFERMTPQQRLVAQGMLDVYLRREGDSGGNDINQEHHSQETENTPHVFREPQR